MPGVLSPPCLKGDLGVLLTGYLIPPYPPLEKGGKNRGFNYQSNYEVETIRDLPVGPGGIPVPAPEITP